MSLKYFHFECVFILLYYCDACSSVKPMQYLLYIPNSCNKFNSIEAGLNGESRSFQLAVLMQLKRHVLCVRVAHSNSPIYILVFGIGYALFSQIQRFSPNFAI